MSISIRLFEDMDEIFKPVTQEKLDELEEYQKGVEACIRGEIHKTKSPEYDRGYSEQYAYEQIKDAKEIV
jgi:hypothetical protein